jgi:hypothetical protein
MSAASLAQRLRKMREAGGYSASAGRSSVTASTLSDRLARMRAAQRGGREEEEEERGLFSRIYYGEEEGEEGRMGIEDIPGQFADVVTSPYEKGLKPLIDIGAGAGKIALGQEEDEDTRLARMAGSEFVDSVTGLPEAFRSGYPVEGVMNVAGVATLPFTGGASAAGLLGKVPKLGQLAKVASKLDKVAGSKAMRIADAVADPMSYGIGKTAKGIAAGSRAAKRAVTDRKRDVTDGDADTLLGDIRKPGRTIRQEIAEYIQSFTTSLPQPAVGRMYDYLIDPDKRTRSYEVMKEARNNPDKAIKSIVSKIQDKIDDMSNNEGTAYVGARAEFLDNVKKEDKIKTDFQQEGGDAIGERVNNLLNPSDQHTGFGGRLLVKWEKDTGRKDAEGNAIIDSGTNEWADRDLVPANSDYAYDIRWRDVEGTASDLPGEQQGAIKKELLENVLRSSRKLEAGNDPISISDAFTESIRFENTQSAPKVRMEMGPMEAFRARLKTLRKDAVRDAAGDDIANKMNAANRAYSDHRKELAQLKEDFGAKIGDADVDYKQQRSKLLGEILEDEGRLDNLQKYAGDDGVLQLLGASHSRSFGGGLVVRSNFSNLLRGIAGLGVAFTVGGLGSALVGIPLLAAFSPQAMLPISKRLAAMPRVNRAIRGDGPQISGADITKKVTETVKGAEQLLGKQGVSLRQLAQQGMTFGQLMQRLEREAEREQRQG